MEKFAVDLDKVLDDFELDEDECESVGHYEKLQLEFCPEGGPVPSSAPAPALPSHGAGLGAFGGWSEPLQPQLVGGGGGRGVVRGWCGVGAQAQPQPPRARSPPDGQNDDGQPPAACSQPALPHPHKEDVVDASVRPVSPPGPSALWPALASPPCLQAAPFVPAGDPSLISPPDHILPARGEGGGCGGLDVVPASIPPDRGLAGGHESRHPDIIDVWQSSGDAPPMPAQPSPSPPGPTQSSMQAEGGVTGQEHPCLPDLMGGSSSSLEPAIVVENTLSRPHPHPCPQDPAIVVESRPAHRLPEVANVHQTAESHTLGLTPTSAEGSTQKSDREASDQPLDLPPLTTCDTPPSPDPGQPPPQAPTPQPAELQAPSHLVTPPQSPTAPEPPPHTEPPSANPQPNTPPSSPAEETLPSPQPLAFSKNMEIGDVDLDAELAELEEEQVRLQGAYGVVGGASSIHTLPPPLQSYPGAGPDLIGGASASQEQPVVELKDSKATHESAPIDSSSDSHYSPPDTSDIPPETPHTPPESPHDTASTLEHQDSPRRQDSHHISHDSPFSLQSSVGDVEEVVCQPHISPHIPGEETAAVGERMGVGDVGGDNLSTTSLNADTLSSSSTLTDPGSPERQPLPHTGPQSPSRVTPGTLVTAVYDDDSGSGREDEPAAPLPEPPPPPLAAGASLNLVGHVAPFWIPDEDAPNCQECGQKFTVIRRRHHCRACGRVLCAHCCHHRAALPYMDHKEARVCAPCLQILQAGQEEGSEGGEGHWGGRGSQGAATPRRLPDPNNPMEYCSRVPPSQQVAAAPPLPPPTVMVPVGVLKREGGSSSSSGGGGSGVGSTRTRGSKQVMFSDGIRPGGDLSEPALPSPPPAPYCRAGRSARRVERPYSEYVFEDNPDSARLEEQMRGDGPPVIFAVHKNLTVLVKLVKLECCVGVEVWNLATRGLCTAGQEELVVLLEVAPGETHPPRDLFAFFHTVYQQANQGNLVTELGHTIFTEPEGLLGSREHGGFLYVRPTFQCLRNLVLPPSPYIFAVLIQKWETPWAKVFPLRLMLRMGAEFRYYPCPLVSTRNRKPVFCEIGHTIMNLLVDFRNYAYTVPAVEGFVIHMEDKKTSLLFPKNRYEQVTKALSNSNDHVLALGANFSPQADSHLVTIENDDGHYSTQAIIIHSRPRRAVTGASFIVFNGALKTTSGLTAKSSIVEDGLMVQIPADMMAKLRDALQNMRDFDIPCGPVNAKQPDEVVVIRWTSDDKNFNVGIKSPVDEKQMDGIPSVKIHSGTDYVSNSHLIRWTEVFIMQGESNNSADINLNRLSELLARSFCVALTPHLSELYTAGHTRLGLRTILHQDNVGYEAGSGGARLAPACMNDLDMELIPVIHRAADNITQQPIILELIFHIMEQ